MRSLYQYYKKRKGFSHSVEVLLALPFLLALLLLIFSLLAQWQAKTELDNFAYEMAARAGNVGQCQGAEIDARYAQLETAYGISPTISITGEAYFNAVTKRVQYGDAIIVKLTLPCRVFGFNGLVLPYNLEAAKITQSMKYWK